VRTEDKKDLTPEELDKVQAKFDIKEQETKYYLNEKGVKTTITKETFKKNTTLYFKGCSDCEYTVDVQTMCTKVLIEGCSDSKFIFNGRITTNFLELWKSNSVNIEVNTKVFTCQVDLSNQINLTFGNKQLFQSVVWASTNDLGINFANSIDKVMTGLKQVREQYPDTNDQIDQFIVRIVEGKLTEERVVRLSNGFPTTDREAQAFDEREKRNKERAEEHLRKIIKSVETKHKVASGQKKIGRNDVCSCGSGKKYKKCCGAGKP